MASVAVAPTDKELTVVPRLDSLCPSVSAQARVSDSMAHFVAEKISMPLNFYVSFRVDYLIPDFAQVEWVSSKTYGKGRFVIFAVSLDTLTTRESG